MRDFLLPDLGEGLEDAEIIAWRVQPGDHVAVDQVIAEVETAKAVVELPVPYAGVVAALHAEPRTTISVGQPLITVTAQEHAAGFRESGVPVPDLTSSDEAASGSVLIGYGTGDHVGTAPGRRRRGRRRAATGDRRPAHLRPVLPRPGRPHPPQAFPPVT